MFSQSIIRSTGQFWKLLFSSIAMLAGSIVPLFPSAGMGWIPGTILASVGLAFASYSIVCPNCGIRWFWKAMINLELQGWFVWMVSRPECPDCKADFRKD